MNKLEKLELEIEDALRDHERYKGYVQVQRYRSNMRSIQAKRLELKALQSAAAAATVVPPRIPFNEYVQNVVCFLCKRKGHYAPDCRMKSPHSLNVEVQKLQGILNETLKRSVDRAVEMGKEREASLKRFQEERLADAKKKREEGDESRKKRRVERVLRNLS